MTIIPKSIKQAHNTPRHSARVAAVQALYQIEQTNENPKTVMRDMIETAFPTLLQEGYIQPDHPFFEELVRDTSALQAECDIIIEKYLADNWRLERLAAILRSILRLAIFELLKCLTVPTTVILNEYIEITKYFFNDKTKPAFVNGILEKISKEIRSA